MPISYNSDLRVFRLDTPRTTYLMGLVGNENFLGHLYYGPNIPDDNMHYLLHLEERPFTPDQNSGERASFYDAFPFEYPAWGEGSFREPCLRLRDANGGGNCELFYESHRILSGKPRLEGLPAAFGPEQGCSTLEIICRDSALGLRVHLLYTVFDDVDAICRSVRIENGGSASVELSTALSAALELDNQDFDIITLHGSWAREAEIDRRPLAHGKQEAFSLRGISSHQYHPFLALCEHSATQRSGLVYGMSFVYSGNFLAQAELDQFNKARVVMGIHPDGFSWHLEPGESFQAPETILVCSNTGLGGMSRTFHDFFRGHLIRGQYKPRPVLLNSWEACYFDFDHDKLLEMGREAAQCGIELLVVDDGWFGHRNDTTSSLGDWQVNEEKLPGGLKRLGDELAALGMELGVWMEPEMISPDSELYRAHPDYAMAIPGRTPALARDQLVLDLTRQEVRDCIFDQITAVLRSAPITYLKWDMNRPLTDVYSNSLPSHRQGEVYHRYMLGVYELQERLVTQFPGVLLENCCSGGGRFDPGMLYYSPQIWTSDNAEAIDRLVIQEGMSLLYPYSAMGAHIAACPSHVNGRVTPFETRGRVSLPGCFGYELDLGKLTQDEYSAIPRQIEEYRQYSSVFHEGDCYRLASYQENNSYDAVMAVNKEKTLAVVDFVQVRSRAYRRSLRLPLAGLEGKAMYREKASGAVRSGAAWMYGGLLLKDMQADFYSELVVLERVH